MYQTITISCPNPHSEYVMHVSTYRTLTLAPSVTIEEKVSKGVRAMLRNAVLDPLESNVWDLVARSLDDILRIDPPVEQETR